MRTELPKLPWFELVGIHMMDRKEREKRGDPFNLRIERARVNHGRTC